MGLRLSSLLRNNNTDLELLILYLENSLKFSINLIILGMLLFRFDRKNIALSANKELR